LNYYVHYSYIIDKILKDSIFAIRLSNCPSRSLTCRRCH